MANKKIRKAELVRKTKETQIKMKLVLDGAGASKINTPIGFFNHLLTSFTKHGLFNLQVSARGDLEIDEHHTMEDLGIVLGQGLSKALADRKGINRFGSALVPMDEALAQAVVDISGRPFLVYQAAIPRQKQWEFNVNLVEEFLRALVNNAGITLHLKLFYGSDYHHSLEAMFKALGRALGQAVAKNPRAHSIPSTKGRI
jgi:imidazoleglycerol-phosphate dehydratase